MKMKSFVMFVVLFGVCATNSFGQNGVGAYAPQQQVIVNPNGLPPGAPMPSPVYGDIGNGVRESWVHEIRPLTQYELAPQYNYNQNQYPAAAGWFMNNLGCWQRSVAPQYNYCVPQGGWNYQNNGYYPQHSIGAQLFCR